MAIAVLLVGACSRGGEPTPTAKPGNQTADQTVPPTIPHTLMGRSRCTTCHGAGISEIPLMPGTHADRTDQLCTICHKPYGEATTSPPYIPHTLVGRSDCLICHATGIASAPVAPHDTAVVSNKNCLLCHLAKGTAIATSSPTPTAQPPLGEGTATPPTPSPTATTAPGVPPSVPHSLEGRSECLLCHASNIPADHVGRSSEICTSCHKPGGS